MTIESRMLEQVSTPKPAEIVPEAEKDGLPMQMLKGAGFVIAQPLAVIFAPLVAVFKPMVNPSKGEKNSLAGYLGA